MKNTYRRVTAKIKGTMPLSFGKPIPEERPKKELFDAFEARTWRQRMHIAESGEVKMPPGCFKNSLAELAKRRGEKVRGRGNRTYSKIFDSGLMESGDPPVILAGLKPMDVVGERLFVPSDGVRGGGKRVWKWFPYIPAGWSVTVSFSVLDGEITEEVFYDHFVEAGLLVGVGRWRAGNGGQYGRYVLEGMPTWREGL